MFRSSDLKYVPNEEIFYIKSRDAYFLDSLLQQFSFREAKEVTASKGTEKETEEEFEEDQQLEKKKKKMLKQKQKA